MLELAAMMILGIVTFGFWYLGIEATQPLMRILFITLGFFLMAAAFTELGGFLTAYTVSGGTTVPYYNQAQINATANVAFVLQWIFALLGLFYMAIEIILYIKGVLELARQKKMNRVSAEYEN